MSTTKKNKKGAILLAIALLGALLLGLGYIILSQQQTINEIQEVAQIDKQILEEEYNELQLQYEGYKFTISNDSLLEALSSEQAKVKSLQEELRNTKSVNARRISELRRELETLRQIMRHYVVQIDSLNTANKALRTENKIVREDLSRVASQRNQLEAEKNQLSEKVELASMLTTSGISITPLDSKGKATKKIARTKQLRVAFHLDRNVTAPTGMKVIYVRLLQPSEALLSKEGVSGSFDFEGARVPFSMSREVEYSGEPLAVELYWNVEEFLSEGTYRVEIFADGYRIGRASTSL